MATRKTLAQRLIAEIRRAERGGLTQAELARLSDMPESQIHRIRTGKIMPRLDTAEAIAKALKLRITLTGPE